MTKKTYAENLRHGSDVNKICPHCRQDLDESNFYRRANGTLRSWCKICNRKFAKDYYAKHPGLVGEKAKLWREKNKLRVIEYRQKNRQKSHRRDISRKYKVSAAWFDDQMAAQKSKCRICKKALLWTDKTNTPHVDHCHSTGMVRGILCNRCNSVLGLCEDSIALLQSSIRYLRICHGTTATN